jgi:hypothetical protein
MGNFVRGRLKGIAEILAMSEQYWKDRLALCRYTSSRNLPPLRQGDRSVVIEIPAPVKITFLAK